MLNEGIKETTGGVVLSVHIQSGATKTEYVGRYGEHALKFRVAASPVKGAANDALCQFLSDQFGLPKNSVVLVAGFSSRQKRILLKGISVEQVKQILD